MADGELDISGVYQEKGRLDEVFRHITTHPKDEVGDAA